MTYNRWDVVEVPFPFVDRVKTKARKAIVISGRRFRDQNGAHILMMITSAMHSQWFGDTPIKDLKAAGLKKPCLARLKVFTLQSSLIRAKVGRLSALDQRSVEKSFSSAFSAK